MKLVSVLLICQDSEWKVSKRMAKDEEKTNAKFAFKLHEIQFKNFVRKSYNLPSGHFKILREGKVKSALQHCATWGFAKTFRFPFNCNYTNYLETTTPLKLLKSYTAYRKFRNSQLFVHFERLDLVILLPKLETVKFYTAVKICTNYHTNADWFPRKFPKTKKCRLRTFPQNL